MRSEGGNSGMEEGSLESRGIFSSFSCRVSVLPDNALGVVGGSGADTVNGTEHCDTVDGLDAASFPAGVSRILLEGLVPRLLRFCDLFSIRGGAWFELSGASSLTKGRRRIHERQIVDLH